MPGDSDRHDDRSIPIGPSLLPTTGGQSLAAPLRHQLEVSFGADLSNVEVYESHAATHAGGPFAQGDRVYFPPGQFDPSSQAGRELLAHELAHVVQWRSPTFEPEAAPNLVTTANE